jgi:hypothetical protein
MIVRVCRQREGCIFSIHHHKSASLRNYGKREPYCHIDNSIFLLIVDGWGLPMALKRRHSRWEIAKEWQMSGCERRIVSSDQQFENLNRMPLTETVRLILWATASFGDGMIHIENQFLFVFSDRGGQAQTAARGKQFRARN